MIEPKAPYADCVHCPLADRPCVPSHLPPGAFVLVVGEAPGATEVQMGQPFVGPSGQLLDHIARYAGIDPASIGRTNAVLCRPAGNADPPDSAVTACAPRLAHEINSVSPHVIVPMGNIALAAVDRLSHATAHLHGSITSRRGKWYTIAHFDVLPAYHPAYVLRSPQYFQDMLSDFRKVSNRVNQRVTKPFNTKDVRYIPCDASNKHRVIEYLNRMPEGAILAFDVESDHLQWYDTPAQDAAQVLALGVAWRPNQVVVIPFEFILHANHYDVYQAVQSAFDRGKPIAHNGKFDQHNLDHGDISVTLAYDTMLAHYVLDETGKHGLKGLVQDWLECEDDYEYRLITSWFEENKIKKEDRRYGLVPKDRLYEYLAIDVAATLALWPLFKAQLEQEQLLDWPFLNVLTPVANAIAHVEQNGIMVDKPYLEKVGAHVDTKIVEQAQTIHAIVQERLLLWLQAGNIVVPKADWIKDRTTYARCISRMRNDFNPGSWQQVQVFLYDVLKLRHTARLGYKTDARSTQEENLLSLKPNDTSGFIDALMHYRRLEKIRGTYVNKLLAMADIDDRVHINYLIHGTEIGRLSATDALHGIPRPGDDEYGAAIRGAFIARPGHVLVIADFSQAELRVFAAMSKEPFLLSIFNENRDPHGEACKMLFEGNQLVDDAAYDMLTQSWYWPDDKRYQGVRDISSYWKERRTTAKNVVFGGLVYLGGPNGIAGMLGGKLTAAQIKPVLDRMLARMPTARNWQQEQFRFARSHGYVQSRFGRKRRFPIITDDNFDEIRKASVHMPVASGASDLTLLSIVELDAAGYKVCGTWHDSIICEVPIAQAERCANFMLNTMTHLGEYWFPEVAWKADIERLADGSFPTRWYSKIPDFTIS